MSLVRLISVTAFGFFVLCGPVGAASPADLAGCGGSFPESVVKPDGKTVIAGKQSCLIQLNSGGTVDPGFSDGGMREFTDGPGITVELLPAGDGVVLVTDHSLIKVEAGGSNDDSFGTGGVVTIPARITAATVMGDGKILLAGGDSSTGLIVARFKEDGTPDDTFGEDGVINTAVPAGENFFPKGIAVDGSGRVLVAGDDVHSPAAMRFLPDGTPDLTFGPERDGFTAPVVLPRLFGFRASEVYVDTDGKFRIFGMTNEGMYSSEDYGVGFDAEGSLIPGSIKFAGSNGRGVLAEVPGGRVAHYDSLGVRSVPFFNVNSRQFSVGPGPSRTDGIEYSPTDGSVIATGTATGYGCAPVCETRSRLVVARLDAGTFEPIPDFGTGGAVLVPGNECSYGTAPPLSSRPAGPWKRCRLRAPTMKFSVKMKRARSKVPSFTGFVTLGSPQRRPGYLARQIFIKIPDRLRVRTAKAKRRVFGRADQPGTTSVRWRGRALVVRWTPDSSGYEPIDGATAPPNGPVRISFGLKPGALRPIAPRHLRKRLSFVVRGTLIPNGPDFGTTGVIQSFAPSTTSNIARVQPVTAKVPRAGR
ncbi:MAG: hypothetical protein ACSLFD_09295 [Solirubrobacterales bacterium]